MTCVLDSTALSGRSHICNTAFDDSLVIGPRVESKIDPDARLVFGEDKAEDARDLVRRVIKNIAFISTFSILLPGDMVIARSRFSKKMTEDGEAKVKIEGLGHLRAYVRKRKAKKPQTPEAGRQKKVSPGLMLCLQNPFRIPLFKMRIGFVRDRLQFFTRLMRIFQGAFQVPFYPETVNLTEIFGRGG